MKEQSMNEERELEEAKAALHLLTVKEVATRLRLSRSAIYNMLWRGQLPYVNVACGTKRAPRIRESDLVAFVANRTSLRRIDFPF
jgi:excisionase family DNA binding protein